MHPAPVPKTDFPALRRNNVQRLYIVLLIDCWARVVALLGMLPFVQMLELWIIAAASACTRMCCHCGRERGVHLPHACDDLPSLWKTVYMVTCMFLGGALPRWQLDKVGG